MADNKSWVNKCSDAIVKMPDKFWAHWHKGQIARRIVLFWALWQTSDVAYKSYLMMQTHPWDVNMALIIGAYTTPMIGLTGFIIKSYAAIPYKDEMPKPPSP